MIVLLLAGYKHKNSVYNPYNKAAAIPAAATKAPAGAN